MGDFSRDPRTRLADSVSKHYVGVRLQQGVPLLDADWNEMEGLRRHDSERMGAWFIGSGVPVGSDGFFIYEVSRDNDFGIRRGVCLVNGRLTENDTDVRYTTQPNFGNPDLDDPLPPLTTPASDKQFMVYLDIWEREVDASEDGELVDNNIGIETAVRIKREWAVRVARVPEDLSALETPPPGHLFYPLARLSRKGSNNRIRGEMVEDLRDTQLSIRRKIEVRNSSDIVMVDNRRFRLMLENTRNTAFAFIQYITTRFNALSTHLASAEVLGLQAAEHIARTAEAGLAQVNGESMANRGALNFLFQIHHAENNFMTVWRDWVLQLGGAPKKYAVYEDFLNRLDQRLNQPTVGTLKGLLPALQTGDLEAATEMQEEIVRLIGSATSAIARGSILVYLARSPAGNLTSGSTARFEFRVRSFTTLADTYTVAILPEAGWPRVLVDSSGTPVPDNRVSIGAIDSEMTLFVDVTVQDGSSGLQLRVTSDSNPAEIDQLTGIYTLTEGAPPPIGEDKVQLYIDHVNNATLDPHSGVVNIQRKDKGTIALRVFNYTGQKSTFNLTVLKEDEVGGWPAEFSGDTTLTVEDGESLPKVVEVTPASDAVSMDLRIEATTTVSGSTVKGSIVIPLTATG